VHPLVFLNQLLRPLVLDLAVLQREGLLPGSREGPRAPVGAQAGRVQRVVREDVNQLSAGGALTGLAFLEVGLGLAAQLKGKVSTV
jgi:hypothetical protein